MATIYGTSGNDTLQGLTLFNIIKGLDGDDILYGNDGRDWLYGGNGNDKLYGMGTNGPDSDFLVGNAGDDELYGGDGRDVLDGGTGSDKSWGRGGDDLFMNFMNNDIDYHYGGAGFDSFMTSGTGTGISSYNQSLEGAILTLAHKTNTSDINYFVNVERIYDNATSSESFIQYDNDTKALASLYDDILERDADLGGIQYYHSEVQGSESLGGVALHFMYSSEYSSKNSGIKFGSLSTENKVSELYDALFNEDANQNDLDYWLGESNSGTSINNIADAMVASSEYIGTYQPVNEWDFS